MRLFLLLFFSFFAQADMDYICDVTLYGRDDSSEQVLKPVSYTHLTLPTTPYV